MSVLGNVFDCQQARRDSDELNNDSRNLATLSGILRKEGIENSGSEEAWETIPLPSFSVRARAKSLNDKNSVMSMTNHAAGTGTCTQSGITPNGISEVSREFPNRSSRRGEESRARI